MRAKKNTAEAWFMKDEEFDSALDLAERISTPSISFRYMMGSLFRRHNPPIFDKYRRHLLEGHRIGTLPIEGALQIPKLSELLDVIILSQSGSDVHAEVTEWKSQCSTRDAMDFLAGKALLGSVEDEEDLEL